jgi:hypothetical protein
MEELLDLIETGQPMRPGVETMQATYVNASARVLRQLGVLKKREPAFPQLLDLNALLTGIYRDLRVDMPTAIELSAQLSPGLGRIVADSNNIRQAIISLILYLRDALSGRGEIAISTRACGLELRGRTTRADRYVRLTITGTNASSGTENMGASGAFDPFSGVNASAEKLDLRLFAAQGLCCIGEQGRRDNNACLADILARNPLFSGRRFADEVVTLCVRWYLRFKLSYRDVAEIAWEMGILVAPSTILR